MRKFVVIAALLALATPAGAANLATPTATIAAATPVATPSPDDQLRRDAQQPAVGGRVVEQAETFEGGIQIGKTGDGASKLAFVARGVCTFDLPAFAAVPTPMVGPPRVQKLNCTATGAAVGDAVFVTLQRWGEGEYVGIRLDAARVIATNTLELQFTQGSLAGLDPGPLTVNYLVVR